MTNRNKIPEEVQEQLGILENSETLLTIIIIGTLIRLGYLGKQRQTLIEGVLCPDKIIDSTGCGVCTELTSSLLIIYGLFGFYNQSRDILNQSYRSGSNVRDQSIDTILSWIVLLISLIRLYQFLNKNSSREASSQRQV